MKIILLSILTLSLVFSGCKKDTPYAGNACVSYTVNKSGHILLRYSEGKYFLVDTGTEISLLFNDRIFPPSQWVGFRFLNGRNVTQCRKVNQLIIDALLLKNQTFQMIRSTQTVFSDDSTIVGIIGMNILSQKYCFFNNHEMTLTLSDTKPKTPKPFFCFFYKSQLQPKSDLIVNGKKIRNILFDTGFNEFLNLQVDDISPEERKLKRSYHTSIEANKREVYYSNNDSIDINRIRFSNIAYSFGGKYRLLGTQFALSFSSFLIDPFDKKIEFYK